MTDPMHGPSCRNVTDLDVGRALDLLAELKQSRDPEGPCAGCGHPLADPDPHRGIVVEHDGATTTAYHAGCREPWEPWYDLTVCLACGRRIEHYSSTGFRTREFCNTTCRSRWHYDLHDRVAPDPRTCPGCGDTFTPARDDKVTCSARCRQRVHRQHRVTPEPDERTTCP